MKAITSIALILIITLATGCINQAPAVDDTTAKDCGDNVSCMEDAWNSCEKAKLRKTEVVDGITLKIYGLIQGGTPEACKVYIKVENIIMPEDASMQEKLGAEALIKGKDMVCTSPVTEGMMNIDFNDLSNCQGSLVDAIKTVKDLTGK